MVSLTAIKSIVFILKASFYESQNGLALRRASDCSLYIYPIYVFVQYDVCTVHHPTICI